MQKIVVTTITHQIGSKRCLQHQYTKFEFVYVQHLCVRTKLLYSDNIVLIYNLVSWNAMQNVLVELFDDIILTVCGDLLMT